jgi:hypothetical protein
LKKRYSRRKWTTTVYLFFKLPSEREIKGGKGSKLANKNEIPVF